MDLSRIAAVVIAGAPLPRQEQETANRPERPHEATIWVTNVFPY